MKSWLPTHTRKILTISITRNLKTKNQIMPLGIDLMFSAKLYQLQRFQQAYWCTFWYFLGQAKMGQDLAVICCFTQIWIIMMKNLGFTIFYCQFMYVRWTITLAKKTLLEAHTNIQEATIVLSLLPSQKKKKKGKKIYDKFCPMSWCPIQQLDVTKIKKLKETTL